jgi:hypothetical protein
VSDLDTLSREIAATGTDWIKTGVRGIGWDDQVCTVLAAPKDAEMVVFVDHVYTAIQRMDAHLFILAWRPDLTDASTLGALLFSLKGGDVRRGAMGYFTASWVVDSDSRQPELSRSIPAFSRAEAIGRAWIAAQKEAP